MLTLREQKLCADDIEAHANRQAMSPRTKRLHFNLSCLNSIATNGLTQLNTIYTSVYQMAFGQFVCKLCFV